jgi:hypothetical protein
MGDSLFQRSFAGGELAPVLHARADTAKYASAARTVKNFLVRREGGVSNRPGLRFVAACKTNTLGTKLMRFVSTVASQSVLIEMGQGYFRFFNGKAPITVAGVPAWSNATNYIVGDLVVSGGINYYCTVAHINHVPPDAGFWYPLTGTIYEIPTPYALGSLPQWSQSGNVITLTQPGVAPMELTFFTLTRWTLTALSTSPHSQPPTAPMGTGGNPVPAWDATVTYQVGAIVLSGGVNYTCVLSNLNQVPPNATYWLAVVAGGLKRSYKMTTVEAVTLEESIASAAVDIDGYLNPIKTAPNALSWTAPAGITVDSYNVYCDPYGNGVFGFIGEADSGLTFNDPGLTPDFESTPPLANALFQLANDYPTTSAFFQQRRFFANTNNQPDGVFGSRTGFRSNFGVSTPVQDDDGLTFRLAGNNHHPVRHLVALKTGLVLLTDGGEWTATGGGGAGTPMTPRSLAAEQETYVGCAPDVPPVTVGNEILYTQVRGSILRQLEFKFESQGLAGKDMTVFATHLFETHTIVDCAFQQVPDSIVWCVRNDGVLLGLTYVPDQDVYGWHRHETWNNTTMDKVEAICVVPETAEDGVYVVVARTIGGNTVRYIERMNSRIITTFNTDCFFVDAGLSYHGAAASVFSGLGHLEGQVVAVVGDGAVVYNGDPAGASAASFTVTAGKITLPAGRTAVDCHIGLAIRYPELETLDIDIAASNVRDKKKTVPSVTLLLDNSSRSFFAGPDAASLVQFRPEAWQSQAAQDSGQFEMRVPTSFTKTGRVLIRQVDPLPLTIIGVLPNVETGG